MASASRPEWNQVFPTGGTRVLPYPAAHSAVADGSGDFGFLYMNLRIAKGRSPAMHQQVGEALKASACAYLADVLAQKPLGITIQIDEGDEVFDGKHSTLSPMFRQTTGGS